MAPTATFIQAVPWWPERTKNAVSLARQTDGRIVWDRTSCAFDTWRDVLVEMGALPAILLEDDVDLADNWRERVERVIAEHRDQVVRLYSADPEDLTIGSRLIAGKDFAVNVGVYYPATYAAQLLAWMGSRRPKRWLDYHDFVLSEWLHLRRESFWNEVPSLVQHRQYASTIKRGRSMRRQSATFERASDHAH